MDAELVDNSEVQMMEADIKFGVIGSGTHASLLIEQMQQINMTIVGVYGHKNRERLTLPFMERVEEVVEASDALVLAIPPEHNLEVATLALAAGKDVLVEKPMTGSYKQALTLSDVEASSDGFVMVGHCLCYSDNIHDVIDREWERAACYYRRPKSGSRMNPYWNLAVHPISIFVLAGVHDFDVEFDWNGEEPCMEMAFFNGGGAKEMYRSTGNFFKNQFEHFMQCIRTREKPRTDLEHGIEVIRQLEERYGGIYETERGVQ